MAEWLQAPAVEEALGWSDLLWRLGLAPLFGLIVAGIYAFTQRRPPGQMLPLVTTLVLLTMLVAMTTIVIGNNAARAFGLVGALSIVRFRTVVEDTRDTSFVIFAVAVGMALGAGYVAVCLIGVPAIAAVAFGLSLLGPHESVPRKLEVRIAAGRDPETLLTAVLNEHLPGWKLASVVSARQGAALDLVYRVRLRDPSAMLPVVKAIGALEGVQNVELKED